MAGKYICQPIWRDVFSDRNIAAPLKGHFLLIADYLFFTGIQIHHIKRIFLVGDKRGHTGAYHLFYSISAYFNSYLQDSAQADQDQWQSDALLEEGMDLRDRAG